MANLIYPLWEVFLERLLALEAPSSVVASITDAAAVAVDGLAIDLTPVNEQGRLNAFMGFGKAAAMVLAGYFTIKVIGIAVDDNWHYLATGWGAWFLVELIGFVALPAFAYALAARERNLRLARWAAVWSVLGLVLNRLNISLVAFNWHLPSAERYFPSWMEIAISIFIVTVGVVVYRFITTHMPILYEHPDYRTDH